jgi:hypothetical protein
MTPVIHQLRQEGIDKAPKILPSCDMPTTFLRVSGNILSFLWWRRCGGVTIFIFKICGFGHLGNFEIFEGKFSLRKRCRHPLSSASQKGIENSPAMHCEG